MSISLNGAFVGQQVTGQQRFATEMVRGLTALDPSYRLVTPPTGRGKGVEWAWTQTGLPARTRGEWLVSFTSRVPFRHPRHVATVHDLFPLTHPEWYSRTYLALHRPLLRRTLASARGLLVVSQPVLDEVRALGLTPDDTPIALTPNAPSPRAATDDTTDGAVGDDVRRVLDGPPYLVSVASDDPRKNLATIVAAYESLPGSLRAGLPLVLVGGREAGVFAGPGLSTTTPGIVNLGYVSDEELRLLYGGARALLSLSLAEGFGLPLVEAVDQGCPVLVSDIPVYRWVLGDDATYVDPHRPDELARAMRELAEDDVRRTVTLPRTYDWASSAAAAHDLVTALAR